jgi:hypothetical protein
MWKMWKKTKHGGSKTAQKSEKVAWEYAQKSERGGRLRIKNVLGATMLRLSGPPLKLLFICAAQGVVQIVGFLVSIDSEECAIDTNGDEVEIDCEKCQRKWVLPLLSSLFSLFCFVFCFLLEALIALVSPFLPFNPPPPRPPFSFSLGYSLSLLTQLLWAVCGSVLFPCFGVLSLSPSLPFSRRHIVSFFVTQGVLSPLTFPRTEPTFTGGQEFSSG